MTISTALAAAFNVAMTSTLIFALVRGGRPERIGVLINLGGFALFVLIRLLVPTAWTSAEVLILLIDAAVAVGFFWLAITTTRFWPIWAAGFALADLFMSIAGALLLTTCVEQIEERARRLAEVVSAEIVDPNAQSDYDDSSCWDDPNDTDSTTTKHLQSAKAVTSVSVRSDPPCA